LSHLGFWVIVVYRVALFQSIVLVSIINLLIVEDILATSR